MKLIERYFNLLFVCVVIVKVIWLQLLFNSSQTRLGSTFLLILTNIKSFNYPNGSFYALFYMPSTFCKYMSLCVTNSELRLNRKLIHLSQMSMTLPAKTRNGPWQWPWPRHGSIRHDSAPGRRTLSRSEHLPSRISLALYPLLGPDNKIRH